MYTQFLPGPNLPNDIGQRAVDRGALESPLIWQILLLLALVGVYLALRPRRTPTGRIGRPPLPMSAKVIPVVVLAFASAVTFLNSYVGYIRTGSDLASVLQRGHGWSRQLGHGMAALTGESRSLADASAAPLPVAPAKPAAPAGSTGPSAGPTTPHDAPPEEHHDLRLEQIDIPDPALNVPTGRTVVLLPPGYDDTSNAQRRYPVVYLVHGYPAGSSQDWFTSGDAVDTLKQLVDRHLVQPMIIVGVDGTAGAPSVDWECLDVPGGPQLETYLSDWVPRQIDSRYRTIPNRSGRALGGMSGGGFCALNVGLKHLDDFATLLSSLPYDDPGDARALFHGDQRLISENTPRDYMPGMKFTEPVAVMLDVGAYATTDVATAHRIANALTAKGQQVAMRTEPDLTHTWRTARAGLPYLLDFADQHFPVITSHTHSHVR